MAELVRALYSLELYTILKVEGSNPGVADIFRNIGNGRVRAVINSRFSRINATSIFGGLAVDQLYMPVESEAVTSYLWMVPNN